MDASDQQPPAPASGGEGEGPLYSRATRWRTYLCTHSVAFRRLQEERERGWRSAALDAWYARRQTPAATPQVPSTAAVSSLKGAAASSPPADAPSTTASPPDTSAAPAVGTTSFVAADVVQLADRYRQHARQVTQLAAGTFFKRAPTAAATGDGDTTPTPLFLDLGCAPGGVSRYLVEDLRWRGVGVSLASTSGGIEVDPALLAVQPHNNREGFLLLDGDVSEPAARWHRSAAYAHVTAIASATTPRDDTDATVALEELLGSGHLPLGAFHFVNGGAVLDHGQRQAQAAAAVEEEDDEASTPLLPWFSLLVPQLTAALTYTAARGGIMLVHGAPHCASFCILLRCMEDVVGGGHPCATEAESQPRCALRLLETMHLAKPPLYVLWTNVWPTPGDGRGEASRAAQTRLLASLSPTSPLVSPASPSTTGDAVNGTAEGNTRVAKQQLWLGESDEGFELAVEGFARYGAQLERIWQRIEGFLRRRRERAEREAASRVQGVQAGGGSRKRMHGA